MTKNERRKRNERKTKLRLALAPPSIISYPLWDRRLSSRISPPVLAGHGFWVMGHGLWIMVLGLGLGLHLELELDRNDGLRPSSVPEMLV